MRLTKPLAAAAAAAVLLAGAGTALALHGYIPRQMGMEPLLAVSPPEGTAAGNAAALKDIIFRIQKKVVTIQSESGLGSGFLYNAKGDIITNAHVVAGSRTVRVTTSDARELTGEVIGIGTDTDIAVVRVPDLEGTEPLRLERSGRVEVGDAIMAVGSPLGLQNTVTPGIISGLGRTFSMKPYTYRNMVQISASIAPGNSGGPLIDQRTGMVLGINSAEMQDGEIGFSIPISDVLSAAEGWSQTPMKELPGVPGSATNALTGKKSITDYAGYLVSRFYESLSNGDYVYAYSLLGINWKKQDPYEDFRRGYLPTKNVVIKSLKVDKDGERSAVVKAVITAEEHGQDGKTSVRSFEVSYEVGYENDQLKLISGKGKELGTGDGE
ncbi:MULTISPECIES: trypsin-like peptidase domain-containing protein [unclassified Paenibacillus]|uniref:S1C family serine protease n=1 Tax=unclassified Paenibacillus TaxID=185978 RepID=UPI000954370E|nr:MULTISPECIES: trypsin-like peptidase domain-containing protein [unclassified Paenibacillus]ASS67119.1 trypsin-like serine protease [Paenibacillus sp. RUD330]SIQ89380.1 Trypsin-like peptidase domain-containing protein [Paenibacillus sp. RU4X]SIR10234.1 Trypsin-like peptidase domain-containing protein [Paenibacillus sp. RU4T]